MICWPRNDKVWVLKLVHMAGWPFCFTQGRMGMRVCVLRMMQLSFYLSALVGYRASSFLWAVYWIARNFVRGNVLSIWKFGLLVKSRLASTG